MPRCGGRPQCSCSPQSNSCDRSPWSRPSRHLRGPISSGTWTRRLLSCPGRAATLKRCGAEPGPTHRGCSRKHGPRLCGASLKMRCAVSGHEGRLRTHRPAGADSRRSSSGTSPARWAGPATRRRRWNRGTTGWWGRRLAGVVTLARRGGLDREGRDQGRGENGEFVVRIVALPWRRLESCREKCRMPAPPLQIATCLAEFHGFGHHEAASQNLGRG
jgi:hypothetical protein